MGNEDDTIYFLIIWLIVMFLTLGTGIIVIMYQVRCFPCQNNEVHDDHMRSHGQDGNHTALADFTVTNLRFRTCSVCGEIMSSEEEGEIHQSCHDVDVMCV